MYNFDDPNEINTLAEKQHIRKKIKSTIFNFTPERKRQLLILYYTSGMDFKRIVNLFSCKVEHVNEILILLNIKRCTTCGQVKARDQFDPHQGFDGLYSQCKDCERQMHKTEKAIEQRMIRNRTEKNKSKNREYQRKRKNENVFYKLNSNFSSLLARTLKKYTNGKVIKGFHHWESLVGYSINDLVSHLESQFYKDPRISWNNYGEWHVDHIIPRSVFKINELGDDEFRKCWSLDNLQPLWGLDNLQKGCKFLDEDIV